MEPWGSKAKDNPPDPNAIVAEPNQSAWDVYTTVSKSGTRYFPRVVAMYTHLDQLHRQSSSVGEQKQNYNIRVPNLSVPDIHHSSSDDEFEQNSSMSINKYDAPWKHEANDPNSIRAQGPSRFRTFPAHQFFARIYRPSTIYTALLNKKPVFLSAYEWMTTPWEIHQKTHLDTLFDFIVSLPEIFYQTDQIFVQQPTYKRHLEAQDLLANCQSIERTLKEWHDMVVLTISQMSSTPSSVQSSPRPQGSRSPTPAAGPSTSPTPSHADLDSYVAEPSQLILAPTTPYWAESQDIGVEAQYPFKDQYSFKDGHTALAFIHYWASQALLFRCIAQLHSAIVQPIMTQAPAMHHMHHGGQMDMQHYGFNTAILAGYGISATSAAQYSSQTSMMGIPAMAELMGMQHHHMETAPESSPMPQMPQLQPPSFYDFGPEASVAGMRHQSMAGVMGSCTGMHQPGIMAHAPMSPPQFPTTPPLPPTAATGTPHLSGGGGSSTPDPSHDHSHAGVPDPNRYSDAAVKELTDQVCRGLCFALVASTANLHPDTLASPLAVVESIYNDLAASGQYSVEAELLWCGWFKSEIIRRKTEIEEGILSGRQWTDEGSW
ncbi:hypothetical protein MKZ38_010367 [Zalerion maritima]|uniref:Uncharacterized protein n=1 Tax=Zalerion maritima TaxID=339359 RepID=A0AAD5RZT2_9PEZI|nr:hypothetical protein MKZ38_010367 [Zalerion maritima]